MSKNNQIFKFEGEFYLLAKKCAREDGEELEANVSAFYRLGRKST